MDRWVAVRLKCHYRYFLLGQRLRPRLVRAHLLVEPALRPQLKSLQTQGQEHPIHGSL
jgi:hypothetical protein